MGKRTSGFRKSIRVTTAAVGLVMLTLSARGVSSAPSPQVAKANDAWVLSVPKRRTPDAPPVAPPALPAVAERVTPLTLNATIRRKPTQGPVETLQQTISRTADRIHIGASNGREWLFERNPRDPRRVSAALVEHASKAIVLYEDSDLRMMLGIRGWVDVLALGFDTSVLDAYKRAPEVRTVGGIRFARYTDDRTQPRAGDVWWSEEQVLASGFTIADASGSTRFSIDRLRAGADATLLKHPDARFPTYRVFDLANWLERH